MNTPWLQTRSGRAFPLIDPEPEHVHWPDIIFALSHINRFGGHAGGYSVAQHSVVVADQLLPEWRLYGLLHDAHEAFIGDISTPLKNIFRKQAWWWSLEYEVDEAIYFAAGLTYPVPQEIAEAVKIADVRAMMTERRDLLAKPPHSWGEEYESVVPLPDRIVRWSTQQAIQRFSQALAGSGLTIPPMSFTA